MSKMFRKLGRWFRRLFAPWQDMDLVRAEVQAVRARAPRLAVLPRSNQALKRVEETQEEWIERRGRQ